MLERIYVVVSVGYRNVKNITVIRTCSAGTANIYRGGHLIRALLNYIDLLCDIKNIRNRFIALVLGIVIIMEYIILERREEVKSC